VEEQTPKRGAFDLIRSFPRTYWVVIVMEFFERMAFFGMNAMLAKYFVERVGTHVQCGFMRGLLYWLLYLIPLFSGAIAEMIGYKKVLAAAFVLMTAGYLGLGHATSYPLFMGFVVILAIGGGLFKPVISGTIARLTDKSNSTMGFGIYYWSINVGSCIASLVTAHYINIQNLYPVFVLSAIYVGMMVFNNLFFFREPQKPEKIKTLGDVFKGIATVCANWRFMLLLLIFSGFWVMYRRIEDSALWLLSENYLDLTPVNEFVSGLLSPILGAGFEFRFNEANIMTINAGVIILFQVVVSFVVRKAKPLPTMIVGIGLATLFPIIVALSTDAWLFVLALVLFSIGEITAYPKLISYVGLIAPRDKVAIYMGFVFLPVAASTAFEPVNGYLWETIVIRDGNIPQYWWIIAGIGAATMLGLIVYDKLVGKRLALDE
jgi:dipeptide/tripeptide permease